MTIPTLAQPDLAALLANLQAAVSAGDRSRAQTVMHRLQQALLQTHHDHAALERRARELMAELDDPVRRLQASAALRRFPDADAGDVPALDSNERSSAAAHQATGTVFPVWFGTNRRPLPSADSNLQFSGERAPTTTLGRAEVFIPEAHRFGETGTSFWQRLKRGDLRDDRLRLQRTQRLASTAAVYAELQAEMAAARESGTAPQALVFIHGFNVSFEEAAIRAAQIGCDLKVPGATAFFSWPSRGTVAAYPADEASIEASEAAITQFLVDFHARCGADTVHLVAHSMGNRGLLRALQRIAANAQTAGKLKFGQIFLAAPDVDRDLFQDLAHLYRQHAQRTTLYTSQADRAVHLSHVLHGAPRAGYHERQNNQLLCTVAPGIDTVAVPDFDIDALGHGYFAQAEALLHDIFSLMRQDTPPVSRQRLHPLVTPDGTVWRLQR